MFELQKAAKLADAAINLPSSVMKAYEFGVGIGGPIVGVAFGAAALAPTIRAITRNSISNIWWRFKWWRWRCISTECRQCRQRQEQQQQPLTQRFVNINLSGSDNSMYSKGAVRDLITRINEEVKDGAVLRVL